MLHFQFSSCVWPDRTADARSRVVSVISEEHAWVGKQVYHRCEPVESLECR